MKTKGGSHDMLTQQKVETDKTEMQTIQSHPAELQRLVAL